MGARGCSWSTLQMQDPGDPGGQWQLGSNLPSLVETTWALEPLVLDPSPLSQLILKDTEGESLGPVFRGISLFTSRPTVSHLL